MKGEWHQGKSKQKSEFFQLPKIPKERLIGMFLFLTNSWTYNLDSGKGETFQLLTECSFILSKK